MKDSIDFGSMEIPKLFRKLLIPTVLGMVFSAVFVITDGIFVGRGIGSDALAAVNITAPLFLISTGVGLMFGVGASVVASIHLAQGKVKAARINVTQAVAVSSLLLAAYSFLITSCAREVALLLGSSERLLPLAVEYMHWFAPFLPFSALLSSGMFFIRLDGSPNYAMLCNAVPAVINIVLDYVFIFILGWGMTGAALATSLGYIVGAGMILGYLGRRRNVVRLCRVKTSRKSMRLTLRNVGYMCRLGLSTFLCEGAIAMMMFAGNYVFIRYLGEDGVAAFSIACYFFPIIFMVYNAIGQSAQPILSYNFGAGNGARLRKAFRLALLTAVALDRGHVHRQLLPRLCDCRPGASVVRFGIRFLCGEHRLDRLFPERRAAPSGDGRDRPAGIRLHGGVFLRSAPAVGRGGHLAGRAAGRGAHLRGRCGDLRADPLKKRVLGGSQRGFAAETKPEICFFVLSLRPQTCKAWRRLSRNSAGNTTCPRRTACG